MSEDADPAAVLAAAIAGHNAGLSIVPPRQDGSKAPITDWKRYQAERPALTTICTWYRNGRTGLGAVLGAVSGVTLADGSVAGAEIVEFDDRATFAAFLAAAEAVGLGPLVNRIRGGYEEESPGGVHWLYRCIEVGGNAKLACRPKRPEEMQHPKDAVRVLIETRGEGGFVILAPSHGGVHPSGRPYVLCSGSFASIALITPEERRQLWNLARTFDEMPAEGPRTGAEASPPEGRPGDDFNARGTWESVLEPAGWTRVYERGGTTYWRRPGKDRGVSATTGHDGTAYLYIFTSSTDFEPGRGYSKFSAYTLLNHAGDFAAAARALREQGYGDETAAQPEPTAKSIEPRTLADVVTTFRAWLHLKQPDVIYVTLATIAANHLPGDPLWLMIVGPSSGGKTEVINSITKLPNVHAVATATEGGLLSGTPKKERSGAARGGLLPTIGSFGIVALKDFTSILSMNRDVRASLLAALREVYDGAWTRHVGVDGGRTLHWEGKIGLLAGCTAAIDAHHAVMGVMGERFILYRLDDIEAGAQARKALEIAERAGQMRKELSEAVAGLFATLTIPESLPELTEDETERLVALASLVARARSAVERDAHKREIDLILDPEAPARLVQALRRLYAGLIVIGLGREQAWRCVFKAGLDCIPKLRRGAFEQLAATSGWLTTSGIAKSANYPTTTARRALEDLNVHGVVDRVGGKQGTPDQWQLTAWARDQLAACRPGTAPEMSVGANTAHGQGGERGTFSNNPNRIMNDFSGKVAPGEDFAPIGAEARPCWRCKAEVDPAGLERCERCGWYPCSSCGVCSADCAGDDTEVFA